MCEPATLLTAGSLVVAAGGAGASIAGQTQQNSAAKQVEDQKAKIVDEQISENRRRATDDYLRSVQDEQLQQSQEHQALDEKKADLAHNERDGVSQTIVAAAEAGVSGQSLAAIQNDYRLQMDQAASRLGLNQDNADYQHTRNLQGYLTQYQNRATAVQPYTKQPVKPVDYFGPIFQAVGQGLNVGVQTGAFTGATRTNPLAKLPPPESAGGPLR